ncbi:MAG: pimeloyl-ACP methyl ester carboxylesterase [Cellvibrionaceae bacterium]|jgi:pimeloyl-ACP methyl ester carboxylesterase
MTKTIKSEVGNALFAVEQVGSGKPVIFLHAGVADRRMWQPQMNALRKNYHAIAYDRRGFGETSSPDEPFSHIEDLRHVISETGFETVSLVGCSQGGKIAIDFALAYPQHVDKLILIAPAISGAPSLKDFPAEIEALGNELDEADEAEDIERINEIEAHMWLDGPLSKAGRVFGPIRELFLDMNGITLRMPELLQEIESASAYERVSEISRPTLVLWGDLDFPHLKDRCRYLTDSIPAAIGHEIPSTAHLPNLEKPDLVNSYLQDFLGA